VFVLENVNFFSFSFGRSIALEITVAEAKSEPARTKQLCRARIKKFPRAVYDFDQTQTRVGDNPGKPHTLTTSP